MPVETPDHMTPRDRRNVRRNNWLLVAWVACMGGTAQLFRQGLVPTGAVSWFAAALPAIIGGLVIRSYVRFVREADELNRGIQLRALAVSFGVTIVAIMTYPALQFVGVPDLSPQWFAALGIFLYLGGVSLGSWQYR